MFSALGMFGVYEGLGKDLACTWSFAVGKNSFLPSTVHFFNKYADRKSVV